MSLISMEAAAQFAVVRFRRSRVHFRWLDCVIVWRLYWMLLASRMALMALHPIVAKHWVKFVAGMRRKAGCARLKTHDTHIYQIVRTIRVGMRTAYHLYYHNQ